MKKYYNEHFFKEYDQLIYRIESKLNVKNFYYKGFKKKVLTKRISQKIMETTINSYGNFFVDQLKNKNNSKNKIIINLNGININLNNGKVRVSIKLFCISLMKYFYLFLRNAFLIIDSIFKKEKKINSNYVLILDPTLCDFSIKNDKKNFIEYCRHGPISELNNNFIYIKSMSRDDFHHESFKYFLDTKNKIEGSKLPQISVLHDHRISFFDKIDLFLLHIKSLFITIYTIFRAPIFSIISTDFAMMPIIKYLNNRNFINSIVISTSSMSSQPLWMRKFKKKKFTTHFINYSDNSEEFIYKDNPIYHRYPMLRHIFVDKQWVWNDYQYKMYRDLGHKGEIYVVGPILFSLPSKSLKIDNRIVYVAVFDVAPALLSRVENGTVKYYYKTDLVIKFINNIIDSCEEISKNFDLKIKVILKQKRKLVDGFHDSHYLEELNKIVLKNKFFKIISHNENKYDIIKKSKVSISIPYTSTAHVSAFLNIPSLFYDPSGELIRKKNDKIIFINKKDELKKVLTKILVKTK